MRHNARTAVGPLKGSLRVPGDKSISHRAVLFSAIAEGTSHLSGVLDSADVQATIAAVSALGAHVWLPRTEDGSLAGTVTGWGAAGPTSPGVIDCGNSGTSARLLMGALAGWSGLDVTFLGDSSLSRRPMRRVIDPLTSMGAEMTDTGGSLPVTLHGSDLSGIEYQSPVASAQVKSAILLAGLRANGLTAVWEPALSRDHTERLLPAFGVEVGRSDDGLSSWVPGPAQPVAARVDVPGDPSSAAFLCVAALLVPGSEVTLTEVSLNPTRTGFLRVLERMGASIEVEVDTSSGEELSGSLKITYTPRLVATTITGPEVPSLIDEIPILAVAASRAEGTTRFEGVGELRVKESDRLQAIHDALSAMGVHVAAGEDWLEISGSGAVSFSSASTFSGAELDSLGDHRLAMAWTVAGLASDGEVHIDGFEAVDVSYPGFLTDLGRIGAR